MLKEIAEAFNGTSYPYGHDFYKAIADREYQEYKKSDTMKIWQDISRAELIKYYDFIFFLNTQGVVYYLPSYMTILIKNEDILEDTCHQSLFMAIADLDIDVLSISQQKVIFNFLLYCREVIHPMIDLDEVLLANAMQAISRAGQVEPRSPGSL